MTRPIQVVNTAIQRVNAKATYYLYKIAEKQWDLKPISLGKWCTICGHTLATMLFHRVFFSMKMRSAAFKIKCKFHVTMGWLVVVGLKCNENVRKGRRI